MNNYYQGNQPYGYGYPPPPPTAYQLAPHRAPLRKWSSRIGWGLILVEVVMVAVMLAVSRIFWMPAFDNVSSEMRDLINTSVELLAYILGFWIPTLLIMAWIKIPANVAFPIRRPKATLAIPAVFLLLGASVLGMLASGALSVFFETVFHLIPTMPDMPIPKGTLAIVLYIISMTLAPAIFEELLFRGVIMQSLRRFGDGFALITSSILFALIHGNLIQGPNAMIGGLVMGYFVLRTGSLVTSMVMHFVNNGMAVILTFAMEHMTDPQIEMLNLVVLGAYALVGAIALVYLIVKNGNVFRIAHSDYPLPTAKKYTAFFTTASQIVFFIGIVILTAMYFE